MEDIPCIFCNTHRNLVVIEENGYTGKKCSRCALIYISPRPTRPEVLSFYEGNHAYVSAETHISGEVSRRLYARHNLGIISRYAKAGTLLELGAGAGYFIDEARKKGFEVYGIELNSIQAAFIRNVLAIPCEEHPLGESSFGGKSFDIIYHCDLLSHFYDPIAEFRMIHGKLSAGGLLVFETGNLGDVKERYYRAYTEFQYPDHLFFFGEKSLRELLERTGFELVRVYKYSILLEFFITQMAKRGIGLLKTQGTASAPSPAPANNLTAVRSTTNTQTAGGVVRVASAAGRYFRYFLRYRIGALMPKKGRPQTVITIARKV